MESTFQAFGGIAREVLLDNARALVLHHDPSSREVVLHPRLHAFAKHWGFRIRACAPYRARTTDEIEQPLFGLSCYFPQTHGRPRGTERGVRCEPRRAAIIVVPRLRRSWVLGVPAWSSPRHGAGMRSRPAPRGAPPPTGSWSGGGLYGNYGSALAAHPGEPQGRPDKGSGSQSYKGRPARTHVLPVPHVPDGLTIAPLHHGVARTSGHRSHHAG